MSEFEGFRWFSEPDQRQFGESVCVGIGHHDDGFSASRGLKVVHGNSPHIKYIRADLVAKHERELVETLKELRYACTDKAEKMADAILAAYDERNKPTKGETP